MWKVHFEEAVSLLVLVVMWFCKNSYKILSSKLDAVTVFLCF